MGSSDPGRSRMRTTLALNDVLIAKAGAARHLRKVALVKEALKALVERESARRLAFLVGSAFLFPLAPVSAVNSQASSRFPGAHHSHPTALAGAAHSAPCRETVCRADGRFRPPQRAPQNRREELR